ncbi:MAG: site-2 protease family protein [Clostridia bacterium]|nr:site-2 protease family protein [Clostridia bacterium]MBQ3127860.1 site-2 protease family protein [Clostridia bacterium]MBQ7043937.1 site-2 protease family protein [Clostridia bacterium]
MAEFLSFIASKWTILVAILFFGVVVMVHELGHFTFAKLFKVKVNEFSMGMGPKLFGKKKGDTQYSVRLLPIGGFVSMEGEDEDSEDERAFNKKPCWQRIVIVVAGALVNIFLGLILVAVTLTISDGYAGTNYIHSFRVESQQVAEYNGLKSKDKVLKIDGRNVLYYTDVAYLLSRTDGKTDMTIERDGEKIELTDVELAPSQVVILGIDKTVGTVFKDTFKQSASICRMVWLSLFDLITGKYSVKDVSGPIGVVDFVSDAAQESVKTADYTGLLTMMALITINIGIFNLLPVPALDGGRLLFLFIELIRRKPINQKYEAWVHGIGMVLLLLFMLLISFKDIYTLFIK